MFFFYEDSEDDNDCLDPLKIDWEQNISFLQGKEMMERVSHYCTAYGEVTFDVGNDVMITSPGRKELGDYRVTINGVMPTHKDVCKRIYDCIIEGIIEPIEMSCMLENIYERGFEKKRSDSDLIIELKRKIFWISLQEDINYPMRDGYLGRKHPLFRYAEALIVAQRNGGLNPVNNNADSKKPKTINLLNHTGIIAPSYYNTADYQVDDTID